MPPQTQDRMTTSQFASWLKKQDPELASFPDTELVKGVLARRPDLRSRIIQEVPEQAQRMPLAETTMGQLQQAYEGNLPLLNHWLATLSGLGSVARGTVGAIKSIPEFLRPPSAEELQQAASSGALAPTAILAGRMIKPIGQALKQAPEAYRAARDLPIEQIAPALQETAGQGAGQAITGVALDVLPKVLPAVARFFPRSLEVAANQKLVPLKGLFRLGTPADEAAATPIRVPGRDIGLKPSLPSMQELTEQAIAERRANPVKTRIKPEKAAPAPKKVTPPPVKGFKGPADIAAARAAEAEAEGIKGSLPAGKGRMVLTPEEVKQLENFYKLNKRSAHERGMAFAGGRVPAEGRLVPRLPRPQTTVEWRGLKGAEAEAAIMDVLKKLAGGL